jgi:hypothetical protein
MPQRQHALRRQRGRDGEVATHHFGGGRDARQEGIGSTGETPHPITAAFQFWEQSSPDITGRAG